MKNHNNGIFYFPFRVLKFQKFIQDAKDKGQLVEDKNSEQNEVSEKIRETLLSLTKDSVVIIHKLRKDISRTIIPKLIIELYQSKDKRDLIIYCTECKEFCFTGEVESWGSGAPLSSRGGQRIFCSRSHILIESEEWIS